MNAQTLTTGIARLATTPVAPPLPRAYTWLRPRDAWLVIVGVGAVIAGMWLRHGGLAEDPLTAVGQVTALAGAYAALLVVLFASCVPWLDQVMGTDRLRAVHRVLGFVAVWAIGAHAVTSTLAFAGGAIDPAVPTLPDLVATVPGMPGAVVGMGLFVAAAATSVARRRGAVVPRHACRRPASASGGKVAVVSPMARQRNVDSAASSSWSARR
jgi:hypothetical protein